MEELVKEEDMTYEMQDLQQHDFLPSCFYTGLNGPCGPSLCDGAHASSSGPLMLRSWGPQLHITQNGTKGLAVPLVQVQARRAQMIPKMPCASLTIFLSKKLFPTRPTN